MHIMIGVPSPEDIDIEKMLLLDIQKQHNEDLERSGTLGRALQRIALKPVGLVRAYVGLSNSMKLQGSVIEKVDVRVSSTIVNRARSVQTAISRVAVVETFAGLTMPGEGFTDYDVDVVTGLRDSLAQLKKDGTLPHLSYDLSMIENPFTGLTRPVSQPES